MHAINLAVQTYMVGIRTLGLTWFMKFVSNIFDFSIPFILICFFTALIILVLKGIKPAILFFGSLFAGEVSVYILKILFNVSRPVGGLVLETSKSFPSGHATEITIFCAIIFYIFAKSLKSVWKATVGALGTILVILVSFSRLYLGVHWFSDVFGGIILGLIIYFISVKTYDYFIGQGRS